MARTRRGRQRKVAADLAEAELERAVEESTDDDGSSPRLRAVSRRRRRRLRPRRGKRNEKRARKTNAESRENSNGRNNGVALPAEDIRDSGVQEPVAERPDLENEIPEETGLEEARLQDAAFDEAQTFDDAETVRDGALQAEEAALSDGEDEGALTAGEPPAGRRRRRRWRRSKRREEEAQAAESRRARSKLRNDDELGEEDLTGVPSSGSWATLSSEEEKGDEVHGTTADEAAASLAASTTLDDEEAAVLLTEVKTALDEAKTSTAHADYTLRSIGEEVRAISQRQLNYEKKYVLNSVFAYVIFCALIFGGLYMVFEARSSRNAVDEEYYEAEISRLSDRIGVAEQELQKYREASHLAFEVYQLIEQARYDEALERYVEVQDKLINPAEAALMAGEIDKLRWKLAEESYRKGMDLYSDGAFEQARDAFFESIGHQTETPYSHHRNFYLAMSLYELGDFEGSRTYFEKSLENDLGGDLDATARYHFAVATEKVGESDKAYDLYDNFLKRYRYHEYSDDVVRRQGRIERARIRARAARQRAARERKQERKEAEERAESDDQ